MANGITTNEARNTYWVVDGRRGKRKEKGTREFFLFFFIPLFFCFFFFFFFSVSEMKREVDGKLTKKDTFSIPHMGDNIEWTKNGDLLVGTLVNPLEGTKDIIFMRDLRIFERD